MVIRVIVYALALLSIAAGIPKILQMPQELGFLSAIGLRGVAVSILGVLQLAGGVLLFPARFRLIGAILVAGTLVVSSVALFASGNSTFGAVSLLPFLVALAIVYIEFRGTDRDSA